MKLDTSFAGKTYKIKSKIQSGTLYKIFFYKMELDKHTTFFFYKIELDKHTTFKMKNVLSFP